MKILLVRHLPPAIEAGRCYGRLDVPLHPSAWAANRRLAAALAASGIRRVWTSPARRCRALADGVAGLAGTVARRDRRLLELDFGAWEGRAWDSVPRAALDAWAAAPLAFAAPGGERGAALLRRVRSFAAALRRDGRDCVVIAHGGPLKLLALLLQGHAPDLLAPAPPLGTARLFVVGRSAAPRRRQ